MDYQRLSVLDHDIVYVMEVLLNFQSIVDVHEFESDKPVEKGFDK